MTDLAPAAGGQGAEVGASAALLAPPPAAAPAATSAIGTAAAPSSWYNGADELTQGYIGNKGWKEPLEAVKSYQNLEKLLGADRAGNTVVLPKPDATPEEMGKFYDRMGRPAEPTGYNLGVPEGAPKEFANAASAKMHELGIPQKAGEELGKFWNEYVKGVSTQSSEQKAQENQQGAMELQTEWGAAHTQRMAEAQAAARGLGLDAPTIDKLESSLGYKGVMQLLAKIGAKTSESGFVTGDKTERFNGAMTPAEAKATIKARMEDKNFTARYLSKDSQAVAEMKRLHEFAFQDAQ